VGLSLPEQLEIEDQVRFCWQRWPEGEALVVLDDVTDYQAIEPYLPPADPRFKLLITTRLDLGRSVQKVPLEELDEDGSIALLESLVGTERVRSQLADAHALSKSVGYLPLALVLVGMFLSQKLDWLIDRLVKALVDEEHPDVATSLNNLAGLYSSQGKYEEAELLYFSALEMYKRLLGEEHPDVAMSKWNFGALYQNQGKYLEAEALYRQALSIAQSKLGSDHPTTQGILNSLNSLPQPPA
jgi:tetratricopeptide (TPR) repeat protein